MSSHIKPRAMIPTMRPGASHRHKKKPKHTKKIILFTWLPTSTRAVKPLDGVLNHDAIAWVEYLDNQRHKPLGRKHIGKKRMGPG